MGTSPKNQEIERKFLVDESFAEKMRSKKGGAKIMQGYLTKSSHQSLRVRIKDKEGFITFKSGQGLVRTEIETEVPLKIAQELMELSSHQLTKVRHKVFHEGFTWEIDVFPDGLVLAEVELPTKTAKAPLPDWVTEEVTTNPKYLNQNLAKKVK